MATPIRRHRRLQISVGDKDDNDLNSTVGNEVCGVDACERAAAVRGLCKMHYARFQKHGNPLALKTRGCSPVRVELPNETSPTKLGKLLGVSRQRAHQILNRQAHNARAAVTYALKTGRLIKPDSCERCHRRQDDLEAHHWDYREPLDVRWLCPPCHAIVHPHYPTVRDDEALQRTAQRIN